MQEELLNWLDEEGPKRGLYNDRIISDKAGLSPSTISKSRTGFQPIGIKACIKIAEAMGVPKQVVLVLGGYIDEGAQWDAEIEELVELFTNISDSDRREILMLLRMKNQTN